MHGGDENARGIQLMAAQFGHQPAAGSIPKPPADQLLDGGPVVNRIALGVLEFQIVVPVLFRIHAGVFDLSLDLINPFFPIRRGFVVFFFQLIEFFRPMAEIFFQHVGKRIVGFCGSWHGLLPSVVAGQIPRCHWARM